MAMKGRVVKLAKDKGFGFIQSNDHDMDLLFRYSDVVGISFRELGIKDLVQFDVKDTDEGEKAVDVTLVKKYEEEDDFDAISKYAMM